MQYLITFLEGLVSFISPCVLPMLPVYISYFAGGGNVGRRVVLPRAGAFVLGFSAVFCILGVFAGTAGALLNHHRAAVELVCGVLVIVFGLSYLEIVPLPFFKGMKEGRSVTGIFQSFLFGVIYSVSLTPCVGAFLGAALMMASVSAHAGEGFLLLFVYSLGLGLPFLLSAVLLDELSAAFQAIKRHFRAIRVVCGLFLIAVGVAMATGKLTLLLSLFNS
ncbi:MAG: cytochrome c biogenesis CcdA family protein [Bacillota bacterium]|jgi:cytochrome c-type biogenesis protein